MRYSAALQDARSTRAVRRLRLLVMMMKMTVLSLLVGAFVCDMLRDEHDHSARCYDDASLAALRLRLRIYRTRLRIAARYIRVVC